MDHASIPADAAPSTPRNCVMRGTCDGPMAAILDLLSTQGVPPSGTFTLIPNDGTIVVAGSTHEHLASRLASPDPPPPRA